MNIVLFGPPGAGKGTQSQFISEKFSLLHVSTGDLLRTAMKEKTSLGIEAQKFVDKGELVPDTIMIGLIREVMTKNKKTGILLDGFPRNTVQAEALDGLMSQSHNQVDKAVFLEVSKTLLKDRLTGRRVCSQCGATYHVYSKPPEKEGVCDTCQGKLIQRPDDQASVIENRLDVYEKNTAPLKDYFKKAHKFIAVDGVGDPSVVFERISSAIKN